MKPIWLLAIIFAIHVALDAEESPRVLPGKKPDGSVLLPNQWSLRPAGKQIELGDFPVNIALHPKGKFAALLHCGDGKHEIIIVDVKGEKIVSRTPVDEAFYGLAFSPDGEHVYCSAASAEGIRAFEFKNGKLDKYEEPCMKQCVDRFLDANMVVLKELERLRQ